MPWRVRPAGCRLCTLNTVALTLVARGRSQGEGGRPPGLPGSWMNVETRSGGQSRARTGSPLRRNAASWEGESRTRRGIEGPHWGLCHHLGEKRPSARQEALRGPRGLKAPQPLWQRQSSRRLCSRSRVALARWTLLCRACSP